MQPTPQSSEKETAAQLFQQPHPGQPAAQQVADLFQQSQNQVPMQEATVGAPQAHQTGMPSQDAGQSVYPADQRAPEPTGQIAEQMPQESPRPAEFVTAAGNIESDNFSQQSHQTSFPWDSPKQISGEIPTIDATYEGDSI